MISLKQEGIAIILFLISLYRITNGPETLKYSALISVIVSVNWICRFLNVRTIKQDWKVYRMHSNSSSNVSYYRLRSLEEYGSLKDYRILFKDYRSLSKYSLNSLYAVPIFTACFVLFKIDATAAGTGIFWLIMGSTTS